MASKRWLTNSVKAGIATAAVGVIGTVSAAIIGRPACPVPENSECARLVDYAGKLESQGKSITPVAKAKLNRCLGIAK